MADVEFKSAAGDLVSGYLADTDLVAGNVVIVHEWWGLNDQVRSICDRFAQANFRAFAPDLYDGVVIPIGKADEAAKKMGALDWGKAVGIVRAGCDQLRGMGGKVAVVGFCMGGAITLLSAMKLGEADLDAAVPFYGMPPAEAGDPATIKVPVLGHFAQKDDWVTPEKVDALDAQLTKAGVVHTFHRYDANHAFFNEARKDIHDPEATKLAFDRTIEFLSKVLK